MPDLGKYAVEVLSSYGISLALLVALVGLSVHRAKRVKRDLEEVEKRSKSNG